ncbi:Oidioi.mRNA.OKI2018_I69.XSR.g13491.t1.cds [Oikopleura dioica]|uniref:Oidioi.mRNA.OKI2018_I69.XSR.g13491.t1.cds n=1 Tax=Oikopleura dioica TaxID=34765 RepID=A0ABN7SBR2_OIKDI|nr:Oidioi.mRNA.OKI2018_I69.XSR.g13491.t1.cds [Oikopleura dioica]
MFYFTVSVIFGLCASQNQFADPIWITFQTGSTVYEYSRATEFVTYSQARERCRAINASLPLPSNLEENRFFRAIGGTFLRLIDSPGNLTAELGDGIHYDELTNARPTYTQYCASNIYITGQSEPIYLEFNILPGCWRPRTLDEVNAFTCVRKIGPVSNFPPRLSQVEENLANVTTEARQGLDSTQLVIERLEQQIATLEASLELLNSTFTGTSSAQVFGVNLSALFILYFSVF